TFLGDLRKARKPLEPLPLGRESFKRAELAKALGITPAAVSSLVKRQQLEVTGTGRHRCYPRATAMALWDRQCRGRGVQTVNFYLQAVKQFCNWLVQDRRSCDNPLAHLSGGNVNLDRRHDRQTLTREQLTLILQTTLSSSWVFRGLTG